MAYDQDSPDDRRRVVKEAVVNQNLSGVLVLDDAAVEPERFAPGEINLAELRCRITGSCERKTATEAALHIMNVVVPDVPPDDGNELR